MSVVFNADTSVVGENESPVATFTIKAVEDCWFVFGDVPFEDLKRLYSAFPQNAIADPLLAMATGATCVIGEAATCARLRKNETVLRELSGGQSVIFSLIDLANKLFVSDAAIRWLRGLDVGKSSLALFHALYLRPKTGETGPGSTPKDADDFGRCLRMVRKTSAENLLTISAMPNAAWGRIQTLWDTLARLYDKREFEQLNSMLDQIDLEDRPDLTGEGLRVYIRSREGA